MYVTGYEPGIRLELPGKPVTFVPGGCGGLFWAHFFGCLSKVNDSMLPSNAHVFQLRFMLGNSRDVGESDFHL